MNLLSYKQLIWEHKTSVREIKNEQKLIVMTSHNKEDIQLLCDYTFTISDGKIINVLKS